jgi:hypothetical protein
MARAGDQTQGASNAWLIARGHVGQQQAGQGLDVVAATDIDIDGRDISLSATEAAEHWPALLVQQYMS